MPLLLAWSLFGLGLAHIVFGLVRFRAPLRAAFAAGFVGQFAATEDRRTAFWFLIFAIPLMLAGHLAVHAVRIADLWTLRLIGFYLLPASVIGVLAFPKSPLWAPLLLAPLFIAAGYGLL